MQVERKNVNNLRRMGLLLASCVFGLSVLAIVPAQAGLLGNADDDTGFGPNTKAEAPINPQGKPTTVTEIVDGLQQMPMLQSNSAQLLQQDEDKYKVIASQGGFPKVPSSYFKKGDKGEGVAILNKRLFVEGYLRIEGTQGQFADIFTSATQDAVARYQRNHGLMVNGRIDEVTLKEINIPVEQRIAAIEANIPRLQTYEDGLGDRYLVVNIPAQQLEAVANGRVYERHNTIVGRPARPTPIVMTGVDTVKFNPYWNAPLSIVRKDILPKLKSGTDYLKDINMKILQGGPNGPEVDPATLNFSTLDASKYLFRQEPGPQNAMATAKIEFKSPFGIYLHDTSEKELFNYNNRFFSSGCIRIQNMPQLVNWVLSTQSGYDAAKIADLGKTLERLDVPTNGSPQLRVAYLTAWPSAGGTVSFRNDVYQLDGSGFTVGQPMPVGEMSPDGKRYVLKPLPNAPQFDAAIANGKVVGDGAAAAKPGVVKVSSEEPAANTNWNSGGTSTSKSKGLFDWDAYRKQKAAGKGATKTDTAKADDKKVDPKKAGAKKPLLKDAKAKDAKPADTKTASVDAKADDKKVDPKKVVADKAKDAKSATAATAAKPAVKALKKKPPCDAKSADDCKTAAATAAAPAAADAAAPAAAASSTDGAKTP